MYPIMRDRDSILAKIKEFNEFVEAAPIPVQIIRKYKNKQYLENETWCKMLLEGECYISSYGRILVIQKNGKERIKNFVAKNHKNLVARINRRDIWVHINVAKYFNAVGKGDKVIHINRDYKDNKIDNLMCCTKSYATATNKLVCRNRTKDKSLLQYTLTGEFLRRWNHVDEIVEAFDYRSGDILHCAEGLALTSHNFIWVFEEPIKGMDLSVEDRVEQLKPYLIKGINQQGKIVLFASLEQAERLTGVSQYNVIKSSYLEGFEFNGWCFECKLKVRLKKGEYVWRQSSED